MVLPSSRLHAAAFPPLFNTLAYENASLEVLPQWRRVLDEIAREQSLYEECAGSITSCSSRMLLAWEAMISAQADQPPMNQLRAVNRFANQWSPKADIDNYHMEDFWTSPLTFLRHSGDCEDYAILKYVSLKRLGFDVEDLRIVVVQDTLREAAHAVLAAHVDGEVFILDNLFLAVLPQSKVWQYVPHYSVNERARWAHLPPEGKALSSLPWSVMPSSHRKP